MQESVGKAGGNDIVVVIALGLTRCCTQLMCRCMWSMHHCTQSMRCCMWSTRHSRQHMVPVTKPLLWISQTALDAPIHFLLRRPNRRQDRRSLRRSFPENLITCSHHVTHDLVIFTKCLNSCLSHPLSLFGRLIPTRIILVLHSKGVTPLTCCTVSLVTL